MVESLDFTIGMVVGVIITFIANYLTEVLRDRKRHKRVVKAFIRELTTIRDNIKAGQPFKSVVVGTPVFSKLIAELPMLREETAEELLLTYSDIKFYLRPHGAVNPDDLKSLTEAITIDIELLRKEIEHKRRHPKVYTNTNLTKS